MSTQMSPDKCEHSSEEDSKFNEITDSSFELSTPMRTRSTSGIRKPNSTTHTRSGRKIKKILYLEYDTDTSPGYSGAKGTLKERNILKAEFNETPTKYTPSKARKSILRTPSSVTRSGRKIKKVVYPDFKTENSDEENSSCLINPSVNNSALKNAFNNLHITSPKGRNNSSKVGKESIADNKVLTQTPKGAKTPNTKFTKSGRKLKKVLNFDNYSRNSKHLDKMEYVESSDTVLKRSYKEDKNENELLDSSCEVFFPTKRKTPEKLPLSNNKASPNITYSRSGRKIKKNSLKYSDEEENKDNEVSSEEESFTKEAVVKPTALYEDDDKYGKEMFGFQTPKHRNAMLDKASKSASKTKNTPKTPKSRMNKSKLNENHKTPYNIRKRIKKGIAKEVTRQSLDSFLEDSGSDYVPSNSSSSESDTDDEEVSESSDNEDIEISGVMPLDLAGKMEKNQLFKRKTRGKINNFIFTSEDYFENKKLRSVTSNHTLNKLKTPRFNQWQLSDILKSVNCKHDNAIRELNLENEAMYTRWLFSMNEGFNILIYGVGSKKNLLNTFHKQFLSRCNVCVINGYFPGLLLKDIFDCITVDLLRLRSVPSTQPNELVEFISKKLRNKNTRLFILIHNIDGAALRCDKIQSALANLAADPNIHVVATLDHINSPLLWDQNKLSQFNFSWEDGTSFLPYTDETSYESSLMVQQSGGIAIAGLKNIFKSLNTNSRKIFQLLLEHQLDDASNKKQGMLFSDLYRKCRNSFLVSSDLALRTQLTEFFDHQIIKWKKDNEHLFIPLDNTILTQFQSYLNSDNE